MNDAKEKEQAEAARRRFLSETCQYPWLQDIVLSFHGRLGWFMRVIVDEINDEVYNHIPHFYEGYHVVVDQAGKRTA